MTKYFRALIPALCAAALIALSMPLKAQTSEIKPKAPMYSYVANWNIPRSQWGEIEKSNAANQDILEKAIANGTIVAYGSDENLVHQPEGETHDSFWSANSLAGVLNLLDQFYKSGVAAAPVFAAATKHWDNVYVSRYYNWHSGTFKGAYTYVAGYRLKPNAPEDAVSLLSKNIVAPLLEKMLSNGTIVEYEIDVQAIHTEAPGLFLISYIAPTAEGIDKVDAAIIETLRANPLQGPAFDSMVDFSAHRDELLRTNATYK